MAKSIITKGNMGPTKGFQGPLYFKTECPE